MAELTTGAKEDTSNTTCKNSDGEVVALDSKSPAVKRGLDELNKLDLAPTDLAVCNTKDVSGGGKEFNLSYTKTNPKLTNNGKVFEGLNLDGCDDFLKSFTDSCDIEFSEPRRTKHPSLGPSALAITASTSEDGDTVDIVLRALSETKGKVRNIDIDTGWSASQDYHDKEVKLYIAMEIEGDKNRALFEITPELKGGFIPPGKIWTVQNEFAVSFGKFLNDNFGENRENIRGSAHRIVDHFFGSRQVN